MKGLDLTGNQSKDGRRVRMARQKKWMGIDFGAHVFGKRSGTGAIRGDSFWK